LDEKHPTAEIIDFTLGSFAKFQGDGYGSGLIGFSFQKEFEG
jgi:hypothetical protein